MKGQGVIGATRIGSTRSLQMRIPSKPGSPHMPRRQSGAAEGVTFIGPDIHATQTVGDKIQSKLMAQGQRRAPVHARVLVKQQSTSFPPKSGGVRRGRGPLWSSPSWAVLKGLSWPSHSVAGASSSTQPNQ
ncbi:hypothetical protein AOLI_G00083590 [Acnodon oligacanthus]